MLTVWARSVLRECAQNADGARRFDRQTRTLAVQDEDYGMISVRDTGSATA